jgi:hypothetical protein
VKKEQLCLSGYCCFVIGFCCLSVRTVSCLHTLFFFHIRILFLFLSIWIVLFFQHNQERRINTIMKDNITTSTYKTTQYGNPKYQKPDLWQNNTILKYKVQWPWSYGRWIYNYLCNQFPITTDVVSSNLDQGEVYNIMWSNLSVTYGRLLVFSGYSSFLHLDGPTCEKYFHKKMCTLYIYFAMLLFTEYMKINNKIYLYMIFI